MADPDDIDKLLREIEAMNAPAAASRPAGEVRPAGPPGQVQKPGAGRARRGRGQWTAVAAGGAGVVGLVAGTVLAFLPYVSTLPTAIGAALGGAVVGVAGRPPRWFSGE